MDLHDQLLYSDDSDSGTGVYHENVVNNDGGDEDCDLGLDNSSHCTIEAYDNGEEKSGSPASTSGTVPAQSELIFISPSSDELEQGISDCNSEPKPSTSRQTSTRKRTREVIDSDTDDDVNETGISPEDDEYKVESILGHKKVGGKMLYRIKWEGYPISEATWEPFESLYCYDLWMEYVRGVNQTQSDNVNALLKSFQEKLQESCTENLTQGSPSGNGFQRGLEPDKILQICTRNNEKMCYVKFMGPRLPEWIGFDVVRKERIELLVDYMLNNVNFPEDNEAMDIGDDAVILGGLNAVKIDDVESSDVDHDEDNSEQFSTSDDSSDVPRGIFENFDGFAGASLEVSIEDIDYKLDIVKLEEEEVQLVKYDPGESRLAFEKRIRTCSICNNSYDTASESLNCFRSHKTRHLQCIICSTMIHGGDNGTLGLYAHYKNRHEVGKRNNSIKCPFCQKELLYNEVFTHITVFHIQR